ncbi:MAG TPA: hypothetical protein VHH34_20650 [Pseudonocardiaceae bacterium]|nr:hypothetical protein [Pseudonocardiaceae bacterium]
MGDGRVSGAELPAVVHSGLEKALGIQHSAVAGYVARLRRARPTASPAEIIATLEKQYLAAVTGAGAAMGGAAAVPGAGTGVALVLSAGETAIFLETTTLFALAVAEVHAIDLDEVERRREVVLTVVLGDGGSLLVRGAAGRDQWGRLLADLVPMSSISALNTALCHWFMNLYPRNRKVLTLGKLLPFGLGAGIAAAGNHAFGRMVVSASRRVFGSPPAGFSDGAVTIVDAPRETVEPKSPGAAIPDAAVPSPRSEVRPAPPASEPPEQAAPAEESAAGQAEPGQEPATGQGAPLTGKYRPLFDYLVAQHTDRVELGFADIDALVTGGLPKSATGKAWWGNAGSSRQAKAWLAAGFTVVAVDLDAKRVRFEQRERR